MKTKFHLKASIGDLDNLCSGIAALKEKLCCSNKKMLELGLIIEELCANIVMHGGKEGASEMEVKLETDGDDLFVTVSDDGPPFDPTKAPPVDVQKPLSQRCPGGLGIHLVQHYTDSIEYRRDGDRNMVMIKKSLCDSCCSD